MTAEHPIPFTTPMIRAYQAGAKTETRRVCKAARMFLWTANGEPLGEHWTIGPGGRSSWAWPVGAPPGPEVAAACPYGRPGDVLRIKEDLRVNGAGTVAVYAADGLPVMVDGESLPWRWKVRYLPARFMPTIACRYRPPLLDVRVERVQDISNEGVVAEGIPFLYGYDVESRGIPADGRERFAEEWNRINGKRSPWSRNDWVWVLKFERCSP